VLSNELIPLRLAFQIIITWRWFSWAGYIRLRTLESNYFILDTADRSAILRRHQDHQAKIVPFTLYASARAE
jgi:hypothetical protein